MMIAPKNDYYTSPTINVLFYNDVFRRSHFFGALISALGPRLSWSKLAAKKSKVKFEPKK